MNEEYEKEIDKEAEKLLKDKESLKQILRNYDMLYKSGNHIFDGYELPFWTVCCTTNKTGE